MFREGFKEQFILLMKRVILITSFLLLIACILADQAQSYTIRLIYLNTVGLMDENMALLEDGCIIQLIFTDDQLRDPPSPLNGRPTGDDVLWEYSYIGHGNVTPGTGTFRDSFDFNDEYVGKYVYIRFFNAAAWPDVTYYGMSPLHTLTDFFDFWDVTDGELYLWTEYPFMIVPEPETWLTLLPALAFAIFIFRKKRKDKKAKNG